METEKEKAVRKLNEISIEMLEMIAENIKKGSFQPSIKFVNMLQDLLIETGLEVLNGN